MQNPLRVVARILTGSTYIMLGDGRRLRTRTARPELARPTLAAIRKVVPLPRGRHARRAGQRRRPGRRAALCSRSAGCRGCPRSTLAASLIPTTVAGHSYWTIEDPAARRQQRIHFLQELRDARRPPARAARPVLAPRRAPTPSRGRGSARPARRTPRRGGRAPRAASAVAATPNTTSFATSSHGITKRRAARGARRKPHTTIMRTGAPRPSRIRSGHDVPAVKPQTARAARAASSSTNASTSLANRSAVMAVSWLRSARL